MTTNPPSLMIDLTILFFHRPFSTSAKETTKAKNSYEYDMRKFGKELRHYHADNVTLAAASHKKQINDSKQTLTFFGVGSHCQNGKVENRIKNNL